MTKIFGRLEIGDQFEVGEHGNSVFVKVWEQRESHNNAICIAGKSTGEAFQFCYEEMTTTTWV